MIGFFMKQAKKVIFVDRDGTLIVEPPETRQVNSLEEMVFLPGVISAVKRLFEAGFELAIVTNQDGLGTAANPTDNYELINRKMLDVFESEGVEFSSIFCCPHLDSDNCDCRKPKTGMLAEYLGANVIDKKHSFVIGDRETDIQFAQNLGLQGFLVSESQTWAAIADLILLEPRIAEVRRQTRETTIFAKVNLDGSGSYNIDTGLKFFDHMLEQLAKHADFDLTLNCEGDLEVDEHHSIEDAAIALGEAICQSLGDKRGIERFAWERILVMDEAKTEVSLDLSGRPYLVFDAAFDREYVGDFPTEMLEHFFQSLCVCAGINANIKIEGKNSHHMIESCFKAFAKCLRDAVRKTGSGVSSTKGLL